MIRNSKLWLSKSLISQLNVISNVDHSKWQSGVLPGVEKRLRKDMKMIKLLHESPRILLHGRSRANNFNSNQFLVSDRKTGDAMLVDACDDWPQDWTAFITASRLKLKYMCFTHLHIDNLVSSRFFISEFPNVTLAYSPSDAYWLKMFHTSCVRYGRPDLSPGQSLTPFHNHMNSHFFSGVASRSSPTLLLGDEPIFHVPSPGHSMGHVMFSLPRERFLFTGDTLMMNQIGRVDLPMGSGFLLAQTLRKLEDISDETVIFPGHGPLSTLGRERKHNLGLRRLYELIAAGKQHQSIGWNDGGFL